MPGFILKGFLFSALCLLQETIESYSQDVSENATSPVLNIEQGSLQGRYLTSRKGRNFSAFTAIPYAKPPVGELRFEEPQPADAWDGTLDASKSHPICPQPKSYSRSPPVGDEDCLYLNVYTPYIQLPISKEKLLPVIVFLHGGSLVAESANIDKFHPSILLDKDVVLIIPNYRLGPIGFFSTGDDVVPGNNGLKDQSLAIKWVKHNIDNFGGNPDNIILMGQSSGAISAHLHMMSPMTKHLIKGVIAESCTALSGFNQNNQTQKNSKRLAEALNCSAESNSEMIECLKRLNVSDIIGTRDMFFQWQEQPASAFKPVIENTSKQAFLSEHPVDILKSGKIANIPLLTGVNTNEGGLKSAIVFRCPEALQDFSEDFNRLAPLTMGYDETASDVNLITRDVRRFYFGDGEIDNSSRPIVANMFTDKIFVLPIHETLRLHLQYTQQPIYYYVFGYRGSISHSETSADPSYNYGVVHNDELFYFFPPSNKSFPNHTPSDADEKITDLLTTLWTNFAATGNPNLKGNESSSTWQPVRTDNLEYLFIKNNTEIEMSEKLYWERSEFWRNMPINLYS